MTDTKSATVASYGGQSEDRSEWLDTIIFSDMTRGDSECHYEQWLLLISVEHLVILLCTIGLIFYLTRVNRSISTRIMPSRSQHKAPPPPQCLHTKPSALRSVEAQTTQPFS